MEILHKYEKKNKILNLKRKLRHEGIQQSFDTRLVMYLWIVGCFSKEDAFY